MRDIDSMTIIGGPGGYSLGLINESLYNPDSFDNVTQYRKFYPEQSGRSSYSLTRHGIFLIKEGKIENAVCVCSSGGPTGIHANGYLWAGDSFLICCADTIFCLTVPNLELSWMTRADSATCFEIFPYEKGYVVHGELEITRLDESGQMIWQFSGPDIFTTLSGKDDFKFNGDLIEATTWEGTTCVIDARTGKTVGGG